MRAAKQDRILKSIFVSFVTVLAAYSSNGQAESLERAPLQRTFAHPLIVGASVSSGFLTAGPGTLATKMVMAADTSVNLAQNGAEARSSTFVNLTDLTGYSAVIGVDFLFWDSTQEDISASRVALINLLRSASRARIPVVLGDIPALIGDQKERSRLMLNQLIHSECRSSRHCYVLNIDKLHRVAVNRGLVIGGYLYHYSDMTVDGLHLGPVGSEYLARMIIQLLSRG